MTENNFQEKEFYNIDDLRRMFCCGKSKAQAIMRSIRAYNQSLPFSGRILVEDYNAWKNRPRGKENNERG